MLEPQESRVKTAQDRRSARPAHPIGPTYVGISLVLPFLDFAQGLAFALARLSQLKWMSCANRRDGWRTAWTPSSCSSAGATTATTCARTLGGLLPRPAAPRVPKLCLRLSCAHHVVGIRALSGSHSDPLSLLNPPTQARRTPSSSRRRQQLRDGTTPRKWRGARGSFP